MSFLLNLLAFLHFCSPAHKIRELCFLLSGGGDQHSASWCTEDSLSQNQNSGRQHPAGWGDSSSAQQRESQLPLPQRHGGRLVGQEEARSSGCGAFEDQRGRWWGVPNRSRSEENDRWRKCDLPVGERLKVMIREEEVGKLKMKKWKK